MKKGLLIYNDCDYELNSEFAQRFLNKCKSYMLEINLAMQSNLKYGICDGEIFACYNGKNFDKNNYDFAINRTRNAYIADILEFKGIRVYNSATVTKLANDKNAAYIHAAKLKIPCLDTAICEKDAVKYIKPDFPVVVKQPFGHGGENIYLCNTIEEIEERAKETKERFLTVQQKLNCAAVNDIRVYIMGNNVIGAVKRTATKGFKANYCKGGNITLIEPDKILLEYVNKILENDYYDFAGIDFLYNGNYYFNEIEDAVGSRSLCILKNTDITDMYLEYISNTLH